MIVKAVAVVLALLPGIGSATPSVWSSRARLNITHPQSLRISTSGTETAGTVDFGKSRAVMREVPVHPRVSGRAAPQPKTLLWLGLGLLPFGLRRNRGATAPPPPEDRLRRRT